MSNNFIPHNEPVKKFTQNTHNLPLYAALFHILHMTPTKSQALLWQVICIVEVACKK